MSKDWAEDIAEMHRKFNFHRDLDFNGTFLQFRQRFVEEEVKELSDAILENDPESVVDALIDTCVVAIGLLDLAGVDVHLAWNEVHAKNMAKERAENPTRTGSGGFDLIKPKGWTPPDHSNNTGYIGLALEMLKKKVAVENELQVPDFPHVPSHIRTLEAYQEWAKHKTHDYDDDHDPEFFHATYYPGGINDIMYEISKKVKRIRRGLKRWFLTGEKPKTDSLDDSFRDISIYSAIGGTYLKGELEGQTPDRDIFNRE
jgi:predicted HAD superfamily Cof-like phosphohydrolase